MTTRPIRTHVRAAAVALCGAAAAAVAVAAVSVPAAATGRPQPSRTAALTSLPVVINCAGQGQTRPRLYILACGDGNAYLTGLHWAAWGSSAAFASGISTFNDCVPSCKAGHFLRFPVLGTLWRAEPRPGHHGQRYFVRLTIIYTGVRSYRTGGKPHHLPVTVTYPLSAFGGA